MFTRLPVHHKQTENDFKIRVNVLMCVGEFGNFKKCYTMLTTALLSSDVREDTVWI